MYDDILGPIDEEIEINVKPKRKTLKAKKGTTLKANLATAGVQSAPSAPTVAKNVIDVDDKDEEAVSICPECGCEWDECECEDISDLEGEGCDDGCDQDGCEAKEDPWDAGGEIEEAQDINSVKFTDINGHKVSLNEISVKSGMKIERIFEKELEKEIEDPCDGSKCHECKEDCMYVHRYS